MTDSPKERLWLTILNGPESSNIKRLMETKVGLTDDPHPAQFSKNPKTVDVRQHLHFH